LFTTELPLVGFFGDLDIHLADGYIGFYSFDNACTCEKSDILSFDAGGDTVYINSFDSAFNSQFTVSEWIHSYNSVGFGDCLPLSSEGQQIEYAFTYRDQNTGLYVADPDFITRTGNIVTLVPPSDTSLIGQYEVVLQGCLSGYPTNCASTDLTVFIFEF
jgi:hypothetical protein